MLDVSCSSEEYALHIREVQGVSLASLHFSDGLARIARISLVSPSVLS